MKSVNDLSINPERRKQATKKQDTHEQAWGNHLTKPFSDTELQKTLKKLKKRKSAGPDNIINEILKHLGPIARHKLLDLQPVPSMMKVVESLSDIQMEVRK